MQYARRFSIFLWSRSVCRSAAKVASQIGLVHCLSIVFVLCITRNADTAEARPTPATDINPASLERFHIRKVAGKHLTLLTDLPANPEVDALPALFDQAVPQWCNYFRVSESRAADWRLVGYLMKDKAPFEAAALLRGELPSFEHGFSYDREFWIFEQPSTYYRRHLLLHEATHSFMNMLLGGCGPAWYMEGIAELLATHHLADGKLTLGYFPKKREELPLWGRIQVLQRSQRDGKVLTLEEVLQLRPGSDPSSAGYAWTWALAAFLDNHRRYQERFRQLPLCVQEDDFTARCHNLYADDWDRLAFEWQLFASDIDYGYDFRRVEIEFAADVGDNLAKGGKALSLDAAQGWQSTGVRVESNVSYDLQANGQFQIDPGPPPWMCGPDGVSIHYYHGQPLGRLLAAVMPNEQSAERAHSFLRPIAVGRSTKIRSSKTGLLYLKINESPAKLFDNRGALAIEINRH